MQFFICVLVNGKNQVKEYCQSFIRSQRLPSSSESPLGIWGADARESEDFIQSPLLNWRIRCCILIR